jgi:hypothetical protein
LSALSSLSFELLEQQIERHDFGERRRMASCVRIGGVQDGTRIGVDDNVGVRGSLGWIV